MELSLIARVEGPNLILRLIKPDDAAYVHSLRTNPLYNSHLSKVTGNVQDQRAWIEGYQARETARQEFYYVIERKDGMRCGLVRLYDFDVKSFSWGSWVLDENKTRKAALESAICSSVRRNWHKENAGRSCGLLRGVQKHQQQHGLLEGRRRRRRRTPSIARRV